MIDLRPYQIDAVQRLRQAIAAQQRRIVLVAPTGSGKTVMASEIVRLAVTKGSRVLFLAHRKELIEQASAKLREFGVPNGIIMAQEPTNPSAPVQVASVPTLVRRTETPPAQLVVVDECHHQAAASYGKITERYPGTVLLGLTATPWRADGKGLRRSFDTSVVAETTANLVRDGFLVPVAGYRFLAPDLSDVAVRGHDYDEEALEVAANKPRLVSDVVARWQELAERRRTVVFAVGVAHSRYIVDRFKATGVPAEHLDGKTPKAEREAILGRLRSGVTRIVSNCMILTEGWDLPSLGCIVLARPTKNLGLYLQQVGRGRRPSEGKRDLLLLDHGALIEHHGHPDADRDYSLEHDRPPKPAALWTCGACRAIQPKRPEGGLCPACHKWTCGRCEAAWPPPPGICPQCGVLTQEPDVPEEAPGIAVAITPDAKTKRPGTERDYGVLLGIARARGYKPGWAYHVFTDRYSNAPPFAWRTAWEARHGNA